MIVRMNQAIRGRGRVAAPAAVLYTGRAMIYTSPAMRRRLAIFLSLSVAAAAGCVQRQMSIDSNPPGALVYLNGQEVGRTPLERDFVWYGTYDVQVRQEGYQTIKTRAKVIAPWWQWPPFDLFAELFPVKDRHQLSYTLTPAADEAIDLDQVLSNAESLRSQMQSTRVAPATTRPAQ